MSEAPPPAVTAKFRVTGARPVALAGGRRVVWRAGDVVFKPLDMSVEALRWQAEVLSAVVADGFRLAVPLSSRDGELVVDGWTAWPALAGAACERWLDIVRAGERFHRAVAGIPRPSDLLDGRRDRWAVADRRAWGGGGEPRVGDPPEVARLLAARRPVDAPDQLVHGDLSGNVLFADRLPPAIIDFSPYWRPSAWASAVVAVDAVTTRGAERPLLAAVASRQMLIRALLFRLLSDLEASGDVVEQYRPAIKYVLGLSDTAIELGAPHGAPRRC